MIGERLLSEPLCCRQNGKNSFIPEDGGTPIFVAERNSAHALNGDKVKIQLHAKRKGADPEGEVIEILESQRRSITGKLQVTKDFAFIITEDKTAANDIFIPEDKLKAARPATKRSSVSPNGRKRPRTRWVRWSISWGLPVTTMRR